LGRRLSGFYLSILIIQHSQRRVSSLHSAAVLWNKAEGFRAKATALNGPALLMGFSGYTSF
ncbi:hypothetical protein, partial [Klebsiella pneumoniae]|uniref:hypothetical protein n=1 Tax=Klebsiella pneumoniae TaxID=573 RepID=UPI003F74B625